MSATSILIIWRRLRDSAVAANAGWLMGDKILRLAGSLLVGLWVARYLRPDGFGLLNYATAFVSLFGCIATLGLDTILTRDLVKHPEQRSELLGTAFRLRLFGAALAVAVTIGSILMLRPADHLSQILVAVICGGTIFQSFDVIDCQFQADVASRHTVVAKNIVFVIFSLVKVLLVLTGGTLVAFAIATAAETGLGSLLLIHFYRRTGGNILQWRVDRTVARRLLAESWPLLFAGAVVMVYMKIDQIMLGEMLGDDAVGIYSAAVKLSEVWYFIPSAVASSLYPKFIRLFHEDEGRFYDLLKRVMGYFFWIMLAVSAVVGLTSKWIVLLLFGPQYAAAAPVLAIHIYSGVVVGMSVIFSQKYIIDGTTRVSLAGAAIGAVTNILLNIVLIPRLGAVGAALATLISYCLPTVFLGIFVDRRILMTFLESPLYLFRRRADAA